MRTRGGGEGGLPEEVARAVLEVLAPGGTPPGPDPRASEPPRLALERISGGCIHPAARVWLPGGSGAPSHAAGAFLKWGPPEAVSFPEEAEGLRALGRRGGVRVPRVLGVGPRWILLEYLAPSPPARDTDRRLGEGLARLHRPLAPPGETTPGWPRDGWIGPLPQRNLSGGAPPSWPHFWRSLRLEPQMARAGSRIPAPLRRELALLLDRMEEALEGWEEDGLSLLHGDLWSGNVVVTEGGEPCLVDPAVYRGHREVDLAMMELFGGFGADVFDAYRAARPLREGYRECRGEVYRLYPLLVHLNLFGSGYLPGIRQAVGKALAAMG